MLLKATRHREHAVPVARGNPVGIPLWVSCMAKATPSRGISKVSDAEIKSFKKANSTPNNKKQNDAKPLSLREFRKSPFWNENNFIQQFEFEHDRYFTKFFRINPDVLTALGWKKNETYPPFEFVKEWMKKIKNEKLSEKDAYGKVLSARNWSDEMKCKLNDYGTSNGLRNLFPGGLESQLRRKLREKDFHLQNKYREDFSSILKNKANIKDPWDAVTNDYVAYRMKHDKRDGGILRLLDIFAKKEDAIWRAAAESQPELVEKYNQQREEKKNATKKAANGEASSSEKKQGVVVMKKQETGDVLANSINNNKTSVGVQGLVNSFFGDDKQS